MTTSSSAAEPSADIRLYKNRASYSLSAALHIFHEVPVAHVAFIHPGDAEGSTGGRKETIMNIPLITVIVCDGDDEDDQDSYAVHRHSGLVEAVSSGKHGITASTTKIDGMIFSPTAHDHTLNYRSATLHLRDPQVLDDETDHEEKRSALAAVTDTVTGYGRIATVGVPEDASVKRTTVIRCRIAAVSCKQRFGGFNGAKEPEPDTPEGHENDAFTGVVPCWTQWGEAIGYGKDKEQVKDVLGNRTEDGKSFAEKVAWANEDVQVEGLGMKRKPVNRFS
ncbi:uncharacterized protein IL334_001770 [Kwoniella shivajii]|uniref:Uncharacterized protein n=1 Tax=Kwoniella shivajii TaxID=564305 RepID=A0ABZ1CUG7_9TREE|nr:hypothetical protein IL334_001770 [Kwoniella shivajii]